MEQVEKDTHQMIPCPYPQCTMESHPIGTIFCPCTGNRLPSLLNTSIPLGDSQSTFVMELLHLLKKNKEEHFVEWRNFYVFPDIPPTLRSKVAEKCQLSKNQQQDILGIIDLTVLGTSKCCLVFGQQALFYRNPRFSHQPGKGTILYNLMKKAVFEPYRRFEIKIKINESTDLYINIASIWNSPDKKNKLLDLLKDIAQLIKTKNKKKKKEGVPQRRLE